MKRTLLLAVLGVFALPIGAQTPTGVGYVTYAPTPVATTVGVKDAAFGWLADIANLLDKDASTLLGRKDADHWLSLTDKGTWWLLQIHDETAHYNFRARIDAKTGLFTVEKGVDWKGLKRDAAASLSSEIALEYLDRARAAQSLFSPAEMAAVQMAPPMAAAPAPHAASGDHTAAMTADHGDLTVGNGGVELWQKLVDGNLRFVSGQVQHPNQSMARIDETAKGQKPFAIVVTCSDSRVPPEILFDQGIGDLFVIRTAGEVVTEVELGSIEYAIEHLGVGYLVVMGHERCGAVDATLKGGDLPPNIEAIAAQIRPAVEAARFFKGGDPLDNAVRENAKLVLAKIKGTPLVAEALHEGKLNVKAAYYDLDSGKVAALP